MRSLQDLRKLCIITKSELLNGCQVDAQFTDHNEGLFEPRLSEPHLCASNPTLVMLSKT